MGRIWFALAVVVSLATPAHAKKAPACQCAESQTYPALDAYGVPTNQKAIELQPWDDKEPVKITSLGDLAPNSDYHHDDAPYLRFHTGDGPDLVPPATPHDVHPSIVIGPNTDPSIASRAVITLWGDYEESGFIEAEITDSKGVTEKVAMGAWNPYICQYPLRGLSPGAAHVRVWAIDRAGNRSVDAWSGDTTIELSTVDPTGDMCSEHRQHFKCGMGSLILILVVPVYYLIALLVLWGVSAIRRSRMRDWPGEHVTIPHGESVARIAARAYAIKLVVSIAGVASLWKLDFPITAVLISPLAIVWFFDWLRARGVVHRFHQPVNRLERRADWLLVDHTLLYCGRAWNRAAHVPAATIAKKRDDG